MKLLKRVCKISKKLNVFKTVHSSIYDLYFKEVVILLKGKCSYFKKEHSNLNVEIEILNLISDLEYILERLPAETEDL